MRSAIAIAAAATVLGLTTFAAHGFEAVTLADYSGEEIFVRFCSGCHGETGRGDGPVAAALRTAVPDLTLISERYGDFPAARIRETIDGRGVVVAAHGSGEMPVWGYEFFVEEGGDIVAQRAARDAIKKLVDHIRMLDSSGDDGGPR